MKLGLYVGAETPTGGGSHSFVRAVLDALGEQGTRHSIHLLSTGGTVAAPAGIPSTQLGTSRRFVDAVVRRVRGRRSAAWQRGVSDEVDRMGLDLLWFLTPAAIQASLPYVATVWDLAHRVEPSFPEVQRTGWRWEDREAHYQRLLPRAAYVIVSGGAGRADVERCYGVNPLRIRELPLVAPNRDTVAPVPLAGVRTPFMFYPAQFWPHKNHVGLLLAFRQLCDGNDFPLQLVFCGADKGNLAHVRRTVTELGLADRVLFAGFVSDGELVWLYRNALALVFPSFFGPDNLPPLEAMQLGCPVIAANVVGAEEQMGGAALLVDPRSTDAIAAAMLRLHRDAAVRADLVDKGRARVSRWAAGDYARGMLGIVDEFESERRCWSRSAAYEQPD